MYLRFILILTLTLILNASVGFAQTTENQRLLSQAEGLVFQNPKEVLNITEHILKKPQNQQESIHSYYLNALAHYVSGHFDLALRSAYSSKELSEKAHNREFSEKSNYLIHRILVFLKMEMSGDFGFDDDSYRDDTFIAVEYLWGSYLALLNNDEQSGEHLLLKSEPLLDFQNPGFAESLFYGTKGELLFRKKEINASAEAYKKAMEINESIQNPFLTEVFNQKISADYLLLGDLAQFQSSSLKAKEANIETSKIETLASNEMHMLKLQEFDRKTLQIERKNQFILGILIGLFLLALAIKLIFYVRNRNKLKMFQRLFAYLDNQEKVVVKEQEISSEVEELVEPIRVEKEEVLVVENEKEEPKTSHILKESEEQILQALSKFESSKKFTNRDMSLGMLASQLNTNTKYLSEVINRHKGKNFNAYINELRINYITDKIRNNSNYLNYKVSYLAEECGYSSHSTFTTVFKSIVGVSPIMFVEFVKEEFAKEEVEI